MIAYLRGEILSINDKSAIILAGDVGYEVFLSGSAARALSGKKEGAVYTYLSVREDEVSLYGFSSPEEKELFLKLISVQGVGPKLGVTILSQLDVEKLALAIARSDFGALTAVRGLGKKTAERIILELKEKISEMYAVTSSDGEDASMTQTTGYEDLVVALMSLGYTKAESSKAINRAIQNGASTMEDILLEAMKNM
ncbi:MAG: Holliday junction branch migration protein RuvA [Clostridia bacterium]|nr:Holliday junction branch migration protein RuvA [Clostridia bacterium]